MSSFQAFLQSTCSSNTHPLPLLPKQTFDRSERVPRKSTRRKSTPLITHNGHHRLTFTFFKYLSHYIHLFTRFVFFAILEIAWLKVKGVQLTARNHLLSCLFRPVNSPRLAFAFLNQLGWLMSFVPTWNTTTKHDQKIRQRLNRVFLSSRAISITSLNVFAEAEFPPASMTQPSLISTVWIPATQTYTLPRTLPPLS